MTKQIQAQPDEGEVDRHEKSEPEPVHGLAPSWKRGSGEPPGDQARDQRTEQRRDAEEDTRSREPQQQHQVKGDRVASLEQAAPP